MKIGPGLFELAKQAKEKTRSPVEKMYLERVLKILKQRGQKGLRSKDLERILGLYQSAKLGKEIEEFERAAKVYLTQPEIGILGRVLSKLGAIGGVFKKIILGGYLTGEQEQAAQDLIRSAKAVERQEMDVQQPASAAAKASGGGAADQGNAESSTFSRLYRTPNSSCVYSFQYDFAKSTLLVRFQAPKINPGAEELSGDGLPKQLVGKPGSFMSRGATGQPGVLYAYYDVPVRVFQRLITGWAIPTGRGGVGVWDELRVRGSIYGHRYRYGVAAAADIPRGQSSAAYLPRMATSRGLRQRSVPVKGSGRRGFVTSSLPEQLTPNRGRPKRFHSRGRP